MFNRIVPPLLAALLVEAAFANDAATSKLAPSAAMKAENQSFLRMGLLPKLKTGGDAPPAECMECILEALRRAAPGLVSSIRARRD
jgi:hypothetical protein